MTAIDQLSQLRIVLGGVISSLSEEELFVVPQGFANNIAWNAAHVVVTQQILHYRLSGLETRVPGELVEAYKKGTGPATATPESYGAVMEYLHQTPKYLREDYDTGAFAEFATYETSTGIILRNIDDAIIYNTMHEGLHMGYIMAMRRAMPQSRSDT